MWFITDMYELKWLKGEDAEELTSNWEEVGTGMTENEANTAAAGLNTEEGFNRFSVGSHPKPH